MAVVTSSSPLKTPSTKKSSGSKDKRSSKSKSTKISTTSKIAPPELLSPTGVADVFQVQQDSRQLAAAAKEKLLLQNSISWAEDSSTTSTSLSHSSPILGGGRSRKAQATKKEFKKGVKAIAARLKWLEEQRIKDKEEYEQKLTKAKTKIRKSLEVQYGKSLKEIQANNKSKDVMETQKVIQSLKDDNTKLREEIKVHKRECHKMYKQNQSLEEANFKALQAIEGLKEHIAEQEAIQVKLEENCSIFKKALKDMKLEMKKRDRHYKTELKSAQLLEIGICKIMNHVQDSPSSHSYLEESYEIIANGDEQVTESRTKALAKVGIVEKETSSSSSNRLLNRIMHDNDNDTDSIELSSSSSSDSDAELEEE